MLRMLLSAQVGRIPPLGTKAKSLVLLTYSLNWLYEEQTRLNFTVKNYTNVASIEPTQFCFWA